MSQDDLTPIPDAPDQDPEASGDLPAVDGHGLSDSPHSGYEEEMEAGGVVAPASDRVREGEAEPPELP